MSDIQFSIDNQVAWLCLNRPKQHNAFNANTIVQIRDAIQQATASDARALVLKANGSTFCAGADLNWMRETALQDHAQNMADAEQLAAMLNELYRCPLPTIAVVGGNAFGGGVGLVACCDIAIATDNAKFALSETKLGLIPATISPYVIDAIGTRNAKALFITARPFSAQRAMQMGLVQSVASDETQLDGLLNEQLEAINSNGPKAMQLAKQLAQQVGSEPISGEQQQRLARLIADVRGSDEGQEGLTAFIEKRAANYNLVAKARG